MVSLTLHGCDNCNILYNQITGYIKSTHLVGQHVAMLISFLYVCMVNTIYLFSFVYLRGVSTKLNKYIAMLLITGQNKVFCFKHCRWILTMLYSALFTCNNAYITMLLTSINSFGINIACFHQHEQRLFVSKLVGPSLEMLKIVFVLFK